MEAAASLSKRYISDRFLPDKALDLIDEACAAKRLASHAYPVQMTNLSQQLISEKIRLLRLTDSDTDDKFKLNNHLEQLEEQKSQLLANWQREESS